MAELKVLLDHAHCYILGYSLTELTAGELCPCVDAEAFVCAVTTGVSSLPTHIALPYLYTFRHLSIQRSGRMQQAVDTWTCVCRLSGECTRHNTSSVKQADMHT